MCDEDLFLNLDSLLCQCALQTRELSQKKNEVNQQIKVCRDDIAKAKSNIETTKAKIESLEEDIRVKQNTLRQSKDIAKSMKSTNSLFLQFEQTLKTDLESRKDSYNRDREEYEKRIASYRVSFQSYKEYYYNNPLAQKLLGLQAENKEIEAKIKNYDEQVTSKQEELNNLTAPVIQASSLEKPLEGVSEQPPEDDPQPEKEIVEDKDASLQPILDDHIPSEEVSGQDPEESQNTTTSCLPEEESDTGDSQQNNDQGPQVETETEGEAQEEQQFSVLEIEQAMDVEMDEGPENDQATDKEPNEALTPFTQGFLQETSHQASPARNKPDVTTATFPFTFSPGRSPQISDSSTSPAFSFNIHSEPSTPGFFGFGAQDEDPPSPFTSSFFGEKKAAESKTSMEFLFNQSEPSGDFQFSFNTKSPDNGSSNKDKDFPFSFNF